MKGVNILLDHIDQLTQSVNRASIAWVRFGEAVRLSARLRRCAATGRSIRRGWHKSLERHKQRKWDEAWAADCVTYAGKYEGDS